MKNIANKLLNKESQTVFWMPPQSLATLETLSQKITPQAIEAWLMSLPQDSPASPSPLPENKRERGTSVICGPQQHKLLKLSDLSEFCSKMCQEYVDICPWSFEICEELGMRFNDPSSLGLTTLARRTGESGCGFLVGTPTAGTGTKGRSKKWWEGKIPNPQEFVQMWPTPTANTAKNTGPNINYAKRAEKCYLDGIVAIENPGGQLNPDWVEWLMGWPIGWTDLRPLAMDRFQQWLQGFGIF